MQCIGCADAVLTAAGCGQAHERGLDIDMLLAHLKPLLEVQKDLRVVIMSASMDEALFSDYFGSCPVFRLQGRWAELHLLVVVTATANMRDAAFVTTSGTHLDHTR
jgi:hypothetical protein